MDEPPRRHRSLDEQLKSGRFKLSEKQRESAERRNREILETIKAIAEEGTRLADSKTLILRLFSSLLFLAGVLTVLFFIVVGYSVSGMLTTFFPNSPSQLIGTILGAIIGFCFSIGYFALNQLIKLMLTIDHNIRVIYEVHKKET